MDSSFLDIIPGYAYSIIWVFFGVSMSLLNKSTFNYTDFKFPVLLSTGHLFVNGILSYIVVHHTQLVPADKRVLSPEAKRSCYFFVVLFCLNIAFGNLSIKIVDLALSQTLRATMPVFSLLLSYLILGHTTSLYVILSLIPIVIGVVIISFSNITFTFTNFLIIMLGVLLCALKGIVSFISLKKYAINPFVLLMNLAPIGTLVMFVIAFSFGEVFSFVSSFSDLFFGSGFFLNLFLPLTTCFVAFMLNVLSFLANRGTSPLTMAALGNVKQCAVILSSIVLFNRKTSLIQFIGIGTTFAGMFLYTFAKYYYQQAQKAQQQNLISTTITEEEEEVGKGNTDEEEELYVVEMLDDDDDDDDEGNELEESNIIIDPLKDEEKRTQKDEIGAIDNNI